MALLVFSFGLGGTAAADPVRTISKSPKVPSPSLNSRKSASIPGRQGGKLVGHLVSEKGFPVAWALVSLAPHGGESSGVELYRFVSGRDGSFMTGVIKPGIYRVMVSHILYRQTEPFLIKISDNTSAQFELVLKDQLFESPSIVVIAERVQERNRPLQQTMTAEVLNERIGTLEAPLRTLAIGLGITTLNTLNPSGDLPLVTSSWDRRWRPPVSTPLQTRPTIAYQSRECDLQVNEDDHEPVD